MPLACTIKLKGIRTHSIFAAKKQSDAGNIPKADVRIDSLESQSS
jgi:hypothetical protein